MAELQVGDRVPAFCVTADTGEVVTEDDVLGRKYILYFYPKDNTPGCTLEARAFRDAAADFAAAGYAIYGVSRDTTESHCRFRDKEQLNFTLWSDRDGALCEAFGVIRRVAGIAAGIRRSTFVIDETGRITAAYRGVNARTHVTELRQELGI